jgi:hypothetical protein
MGTAQQLVQYIRYSHFHKLLSFLSLQGLYRKTWGVGGMAKGADRNFVTGEAERDSTFVHKPNDSFSYKNRGQTPEPPQNPVGGDNAFPHSAKQFGISDMLQFGGGADQTRLLPYCL